MGIKTSLGKLKFSKGFKHLLSLIEDNGFEILPITTDHALIVSTLDFIHRDPFDRVLIAQGMHNNMIIITKDQNIKRYCVPTTW
ncbi:MAG: type II toxin-antitoxin system VapC family toxin [Bacteroidales bacterium]